MEHSWRVAGRSWTEDACTAYIIGGTEEEYREYYYYVLEAKLYLHENIYVSIMTEFVENKDNDSEKQDCERKAAKRLMKQLKEQFPMLPVLFCADSLYACESMFELCRKYSWSFLIRYKKGRIPSVYQEYESLQKQEKNYQESRNNGSLCWYDHINGIDYNGCPINLLEYGESEGKLFCFLTNLPITLKNRAQLLIEGRRRWTIERIKALTPKRTMVSIWSISSAGMARP